MRRFENIMKSFALSSKANKCNLTELYTSSGDTFHKYKFENIFFSFTVTSPRTIEKPMLYIDIPYDIFRDFDKKYATVYEDFLLRALSSDINSMSDEWKNIDKDISLKGEISAQQCNEIILRRNGCIYSPEKKAFVLCLMCRFPLQNGTWINVKAGIKMIKSVMNLVFEKTKSLDMSMLTKHISTARKQKDIRTYLEKNALCAFVADGSILPRENGTNLPMKNAIPFVSPPEMSIKIPLSDGTYITGMAVKQGVTVITGGGYSGKSTLIDAIEMGIYNHVPDDGREFVLTDLSALKIYAEDGRPVCNLDITPFFKYLPGDSDISNFSTTHASGSVSQAANIIEAVCSCSRLLLIDEDKSATNFMIRDANMRKIVKNEPIIPFTDRVSELYRLQGVSTVLVIGGSSEYIRYADEIILMDDYKAKNITSEVKKMFLDSFSDEITENEAFWVKSRRLIPKETNQPFLYFRTIKSENARKIILDEYSADITLLTALVTDNQINMLAFIMEGLLTDKSSDKKELSDIINETIKKLFSSDFGDLLISYNYKCERWFEEVRPIDVFCCISRMRGVTLKSTSF